MMRLQVQGINRLLSDVYGSTRLLGEVLLDCGLSEAEIKRLRTYRMAAFLEALLERWNAWFGKTMPNIRWPVIVRRYSLDGNPRSSLREVGHSLGRSHEWIRLLEQSAMERLRSRGQKAMLETLICHAAKDVLKTMSADVDKDGAREMPEDQAESEQ